MIVRHRATPDWTPSEVLQVVWSGVCLLLGLLFIIWFIYCVGRVLFS